MLKQALLLTIVCIFANQAMAKECTYTFSSVPKESRGSYIFDQRFYFDLSDGSKELKGDPKLGVSASAIEFLLIEFGLKKTNDQLYLDDLALLNGKAFKLECYADSNNPNHVLMDYIELRQKQVDETAQKISVKAFAAGKTPDFSTLPIASYMYSIAGEKGLQNLNEALKVAGSEYRIKEINYDTPSYKYWSNTFGVSTCNPQRNVALVNTKTNKIERAYWVAYCSGGYREKDQAKLGGLSVEDFGDPR